MIAYAIHKRKGMASGIPSEVAGPARVDDGIHAGIDPSEPGDDGDDALRLVDARQAERGEQVRDEEREPARDEHAHHDAERPAFEI